MLNKNFQWLKLESQLFKGVGAGAGEKLPGAGQKRIGSATLQFQLTSFVGKIS